MLHLAYLVLRKIKLEQINETFLNFHDISAVSVEERLFNLFKNNVINARMF